jgi:F420-dependent oxidoreductase-like protein
VRLGLNLGYWGMGTDADNVKLAQVADQLGYDVAWAAEAYGSDAVTVLTWVAAKTERIDVGSAILQIPARTPTMTAMTAATLDTLSGGRFRLGLGLSGPQVSEGWHGVSYAKPLARTREYVDIVRLALSRERVRYDGRTYQLPLPDGPGKALHLMVHPVREHIPIYIASIGPKNLELTGEIADGWLAVFFAPKYADELLGHLAAGRAKAGKSMDGFDVVPSTPLVVGDDVEECAKQVRPYAALYIGGMGSREHNFYNDLAVRMGYGDAAATVQDKFLAKDYQGAAEAVPLEFVDSTALLGPPGRIAERMAELADAGATTLSIAPGAATMDEKMRALETAQEALAQSGVAS